MLRIPGLEHIVFTGVVTLESGIQLVYFARRVYFAREKYGIKYPAVTGNVDFERVYRAQQNTLEWYPVYMTVLWTSSIFFHQVPSAICGALYLISRHRYFNGYERSVEGRLPGFKMGFGCLVAMGAMAALGLLRALSSMHHGSGFEEVIRPVFRSCRFQ